MAGRVISRAPALAASTRVLVPERGSVTVDARSWERLRVAAEFGRLQAEGILGVSYQPGGSVKLEGSCYVGHAVCNRIVLELQEKVPGALAALLHFATYESFRIMPATAVASDLGVLITLLIRQFLDATLQYVSSGRLFAYKRFGQIAPLGGGRLDIGKTIRLRARGCGHLLAFDRNALTHDVDQNIVIAAALREVDRLSRSIAMSAHDLARARGLSMIFADCKGPRFYERSRIDFSDMATAIARTAQTARLRDLAALSGVIISHESFDIGGGGASGIPRAWFLNLETLFETAVRTTCSGLLKGSFRVASRKTNAERVFSGEKNEYRANPDLQLTRAGGEIVIGDVKYKNSGGKPKASDLYQLLAHAGTYKAQKAFLIYPGEKYSFRSLGSTRTGITTMVGIVDVLQLRTDLEKFLHDSGLIPS